MLESHKHTGPSRQRALGHQPGLQTPPILISLSTHWMHQTSPIHGGPSIQSIYCQCLGTKHQSTPPRGQSCPGAQVEPTKYWCLMFKSLFLSCNVTIVEQSIANVHNHTLQCLANHLSHTVY